MKRKFCFGMALALLLLAGCQQAFDPRQLVERYSAGSLQAEYVITTHAGFCAEYQLSCQTEGDAAKVTLLGPESVAGVTAVLQKGEARLQYEDLSLDALLPEVAGFSPMDALHCLMNDLGSAPPEAYALEGDFLTADYPSVQGQIQLLKRATFQRETLDLVSAELYLDGSLILTITPQSFQWTPAAQ